MIVPLTVALFLLVLSIWIPDPFVYMPSVENVTRSRVPNVTIVTELTELDPNSPFVALSLAFGSTSIKLFSCSLSLLFYAPDTRRPYEYLEASTQTRRSRFHLFKTSFINSSKVQANISLPTMPTRTSLATVWTVADPAAFSYLQAVKIVLLLLSVPGVVVACRQFLERARLPLVFQQQRAISLFFAAILSYEPLTLFSSSSFVRRVQATLSDLVVGCVSLESILIFTPLFADASIMSFSAPPSIAFAVGFAWAVFDRVTMTRITLFPDSTIGITLSGRLFLLLFGHIALFTVYVLAASAKVPESKSIRFTYTLLAGGALSAGSLLYVVLGIAEHPIINTAFFMVLPFISLFVYATFIFHGYQDTIEIGAFGGGKVPEEIRIGGDTSIGIDANDPAPFDLDSADRF
jgi:hypothetical protein